MNLCFDLMVASPMVELNFDHDEGPAIGPVPDIERLFFRPLSEPVSRAALR
jgi:hypothetical protein